MFVRTKGDNNASVIDYKTNKKKGSDVPTSKLH